MSVLEFKVYNAQLCSLRLSSVADHVIEGARCNHDIIKQNNLCSFDYFGLRTITAPTTCCKGKLIFM